MPVTGKEDEISIPFDLVRHSGLPFPKKNPLKMRDYMYARLRDRDKAHSTTTKKTAIDSALYDLMGRSTGAITLCVH